MPDLALSARWKVTATRPDGDPFTLSYHRTRRAARRAAAAHRRYADVIGDRGVKLTVEPRYQSARSVIVAARSIPRHDPTALDPESHRPAARLTDDQRAEEPVDPHGRRV